MYKSWTNDLNTGIPEIDAEHRKLVAYINLLVTAKKTGLREKLGEILDLLLGHVCNQFMLEEHMMELANYEYRSAHTKVHEMFAKHLADLRGRYKAGETPFDEAIEMLVHWVDVHIRNQDKMYADTVLKSMVQEDGMTWIGSVMNRLIGYNAGGQRL